MKQPPFSQEYQLVSKLRADDEYKSLWRRFLPGHPQVLLDDHESLVNFLQREFCSPDIDKISPWLWMMSLQSHANISPLHRQRVKQRDIIITEDPKLHLVWFYDRIFIKPIPRNLLSFDFWQDHLLENDKSPIESANRQAIRAAALGYLRTWHYLIKHESDFKIAQDSTLQLVPHDLSWPQFCTVCSQFNHIPNYSVSPRYRYGEVRLTRLNFYAKFILHKWAYQRMNTQYGAYFAQFYGPILFVLGIFSVLLNCLQVALTAEQAEDLERQWKSFRRASKWFSVDCSIFMAGLILVLGLLFAFKFVVEWKKALTDRRKSNYDVERHLDR